MIVDDTPAGECVCVCACMYVFVCTCMYVCVCVCVCLTSAREVFCSSCCNKHFSSTLLRKQL